MTSLARVLLTLGLSAALIWSLVNAGAMWSLGQTSGKIGALVAGTTLFALSIYFFLQARKALFAAQAGVRGSIGADEG